MRNWKVITLHNEILVTFRYYKYVSFDTRGINRKNLRQAIKLAKTELRYDCAKKLKGNK